jgi:hypothetical protein
MLGALSNLATGVVDLKVSSTKNHSGDNDTRKTRPVLRKWRSFVTSFAGCFLVSFANPRNLSIFVSCTARLIGLSLVTSVGISSTDFRRVRILVVFSVLLEPRFSCGPY